MASKSEILSILQKILINEGRISIILGNDVRLGKLTTLSRRINEVADEINRLYGTNFKGSQLLCMTLSEIADILLQTFPETSGKPSSSKSGPKIRRLNMVVVGRSGVGKSSFLNYAAGKKVFETGMGDPVTQSYFDVIDVDVPEKKVTYSLFDTKGLEAGNTDEWKKAIYSEIERRDESDDIYDWFHTIIYCIDASSKRIQPFEIKAINEMAEKGSVLVLLTKKDLVTPEILDDLRKQLLNEVGDQVQVLSVCSVSTRTRKGESKASGLEDVLRVSFLGLWEKAAKMLPRMVIGDMVLVNRTLVVDKDLADLCAFATLVGSFTNDNGEEKKAIIDGYDIANTVKCDFYSVIGKEKDIPFSWFEKIGEVMETPVCMVSGDVQIDIRDWYFASILTLPDKLDHDLLDAWYYRGGVGTYIRLVNEIFANLLLRMKNEISNLRNRVGKNGSIIREILNFYNDVNGTNQKPLFNHKTEEAISELERFDYQKNLEKFERLSSLVKSALREVGNCTFMSGSERRGANSCYSDFRGWATETVNELERRVQNFIKSYEAELHSYGQYCIREDEFMGSKKAEYNQANENKQLIMLKTMIRTALSDGNITLKERMMLESVAELQGVSREELDRLIIEIMRS
ncbi:GTPase domain-containing protein [uncultured Duncaniella sp.]|uniref:GTPase domain-containing protein n=1 Tax=uncultured Duncaniella sp. TaxID=2768039 RepID=UPI00261E9620|nr:GTPase domain-containing protein [uncultured Duncaniella sp.]